MIDSRTDVSLRFASTAGPGSFDWLIWSPLSFVIRQNAFFCFGFTTYNWKLFKGSDHKPDFSHSQHVQSSFTHVTQAYISFSAWSRARLGQCLVSVISINWLWAYLGSLTGTVCLSLGSQHACHCWRRREWEVAGLWFLLRRNGNFRCTNRRQCWKVSFNKRWEMFLPILTRICTSSTYYLKASRE